MATTTQIADALRELTGDWSAPGGSRGATLAELGESRRAIGAALQRGAVVADLRPLARLVPVRGAPVNPAIDALVHELPSHPASASVPRIRSEADLTLAQTTGPVFDVRPTRTLGPFIDRLGIRHFVDLFPIVQKFLIENKTHGILAELVVKEVPPANLKAGSLWIAVPALGVAGGGVVGVAFASATAHVQGTLQHQPGKVLIGPGAKLTLTLELAPPASPLPGSGLGADATQMTLALPAHATIEFTAAGVRVIAYDQIAAAVYGTSLTCNRQAHSPRRTTLGGDLVIFPGDLSIAQFPVAACLSPEVAVAGGAALTAGASGWALGVVTQPIAQLGAAPGAGALYLELGPGLTLKYGTLTEPTPLASAQLLLTPGTIVIGGVLGRAVGQRLTLWDAPPADPNVAPASSRHASELLLRARRKSHLVALVSKSLESVLAETTVRANVDRPLEADGRRMALVFNSALVGFVHDASAQRVLVAAQAPNAKDPAGTIALENVLALCGPARSAVLLANRTGMRLTGMLAFGFDQAGLIPTLPDPYATNFVNPRERGKAGATLVAFVRWTTSPQLAFLLSLAPTGSTSFASTHTGGLTLLDLSTNADQFGVQLLAARDAGAGIAIDGLALVAPQQTLASYALPGISWEPVVDDRTHDWYDAYAADDGPPTRLAASTVNLVRVEPKVALVEFANAAAAANVVGQFTLPFGLIANLDVNTKSSATTGRPTLSLIRANYASGVAAALQLAIMAAPGKSDAALPGSTSTGAPIPVHPPPHPPPLDPPTPVYGAAILGANEIVNGQYDTLSAADFFDEQFTPHSPQSTPEIPVARIDLSGYGTSIFSDWRDDNIHKVGVVRARFDVLIGRTAYEIIQLQSVIVPWSIRITRIIIFERFDNGLIVRHDTGWKAVGEGKFELFAPGQVLRGGVDQLANIHNISIPSP